MIDIYETFGAEARKGLPQCASAATIIYGLFVNLGGNLLIDQHGKRRLMIPEPCAFDGDLPQLPKARPHENFQNDDEFRGAVKYVVGLMSRLHPDDKAFIFDAFATVFTPIEAGEPQKAA